MCIVCILYDKEKITRTEAMRALWEQIEVAADDPESERHIVELYAALDKEQI